jgi:hypothetical protein
MSTRYVPEAYGCSIVSPSWEILDVMPLNIENLEDVEALPVLGGMEGPFTNCA